MTSEMDKLAEEMKCRSSQEVEAKKELERQVDEWPGQVQKLIDTIDDWITPLKRSGLSTETQTKHVREDKFSFDIPKYIISYRDKRASTEATLISFGARGRVDLSGPHNTVLTMIMKVDDNGEATWHRLVQGSQRLSYEDLTQDHLASFIRKSFKI